MRVLLAEDEPRVAADVVYLWPERTVYDDHHYWAYGPGWGWGYGYGWGPGWYGRWW